MKAMIFAAGLGTRLKPLTNITAKALVPVNGEPLLQNSFNYLEKYDISEVVVNTHHFSKKVIDFCKTASTKLNITISDESDLLLDTGGGLKKAGEWLKNSNEPIVVINADIITNLNLADMLANHNSNRNLATLAVRDRKSSRKLVFNDVNKLVGWKNLKTGEIKKVNEVGIKGTELAFSGIHIVSPEIFRLFPLENKFSIIEFYLSAAKNSLIGAYRHESDYWFDIGSVDKLKEAEEFLKKMGHL